MAKIINYLEKVYASGGTSVYVYIVVGGVALILILLILLTLINKKEKSNEESSIETKVSKKQKKMKKNIQEEKPAELLKEESTTLELPKKETNLKDEIPETKDDFSFVYVESPNIKPIVDMPIEKDKPIEKPIVDMPVEKPIVDMPIEKPKIEQSQNSEIFTPNIDIPVSVPEFKEPQILEDFPGKKEDPVVEIVPDVISKSEFEKFNTPGNYSDKPLKTFGIKSKLINEEDLPILQTDSLKEEPIVLEVDDIKSKLANISSNKKSDDEKSLDELLKQMGVDNSPKINGEKDEEDILLGK